MRTRGSEPAGDGTRATRGLVRVPDLGIVAGEPADRFEPGDWWQLHRDQVVVITDVEPASTRLRWVTYRPVHGEGNPDLRITDRLHVDRLVARISLAERREHLRQRAQLLRTLCSQALHERHHPRAKQCAWTLRHVIEPELADCEVSWRSAPESLPRTAGPPPGR